MSIYLENLDLQIEEIEYEDFEDSVQRDVIATIIDIDLFISEMENEDDSRS